MYPYIIFLVIWVLAPTADLYLDGGLYQCLEEPRDTVYYIYIFIQGTISLISVLVFVIIVVYNLVVHFNVIYGIGFFYDAKMAIFIKKRNKIEPTRMAVWSSNPDPPIVIRQVF